MKDYKIGLFVFLILATIISLIPPYQWGNEYLKTQKEREENSYIIKYLPIKQYNFLFASNKKYFPIGSYRISEILYQGERLRIDTSDILAKDVEGGEKGIDTFFYKFHKYQESDWDKYYSYDKKRENLKTLYTEYWVNNIPSKKTKYLGLDKPPDRYREEMNEYNDITNRISNSIKMYKIFSFQKPSYYLLSREIIFSELVIEYLLAGFTALFIQIIITFVKRNPLNKKFTS